MSDRLTLLLLRLYDRVALRLEWLGLRLGWLSNRRSSALLEAIFGAEEPGSESIPELWLDRWLRKASRLEQSAMNRCSSDKPTGEL